jgi:hypothetical protein
MTPTCALGWAVWLADPALPCDVPLRGRRYRTRREARRAAAKLNRRARAADAGRVRTPCAFWYCGPAKD